VSEFVRFQPIGVPRNHPAFMVVAMMVAVAKTGGGANFFTYHGVLLHDFRSSGSASGLSRMCSGTESYDIVTRRPAQSDAQFPGSTGFISQRDGIFEGVAVPSYGSSPDTQCS